MNAEAERVVQIGPDRVTVTSSEVIIEARREMPDWQVREFKAAPVYFEDKRYFLAGKAAGSRPGCVRYTLKPWIDGEMEAGKLFYTYDEEAVAERDAAHRGGSRDDLVHKALLPLYPFLGFLWSGTQRRLERLGFVAHSITGVSVFSGFILMFMQLVFAVVLVNSSIRSGQMMVGGLVRALVDGNRIEIGPIGFPTFPLDTFLLLALMADVAMRYTYYLRDEEWYGGFLEWLKPRTRKPKTPS